MKYITILLLFFATSSFGQSKSLTNVIQDIDYQSDTIRAVYDWITENVKYDVGKLKDLERGVNFYKKGKYKNTEEYKAVLLEKVIKKKKGVCEDYTLLFDSIVSELGYESHVIGGLTKDKKGKVRKGGSHSWIAVWVDGEWKLYDPTWGAGYVNDKRRFVKKYSDKWYDVSPEEIKKTHLPFDMIWQLSNEPITYKEFETGSKAKSLDVPKDYNEMISDHLQKERLEQYKDELHRLELIGGNISKIKQRKNYLQKKIDLHSSKENANLINKTLDDCRANSQLFSEYIKAKNNGFKGEPWTVDYAKSTLLDLESKVKASTVTLKGIKVKKAKSKKAFKKYISQSKKLEERIANEIQFLERKS